MTKVDEEIKGVQEEFEKSRKSHFELQEKFIPLTSDFAKLEAVKAMREDAAARISKERTESDDLAKKMDDLKVQMEKLGKIGMDLESKFTGLTKERDEYMKNAIPPFDFR